MNSNVLIAILVMTKVISPKEADRLAREFPGRVIPDSWEYVVKDVNEIIGRKISTKISIR